MPHGTKVHRLTNKEFFKAFTERGAEHFARRVGAFTDGKNIFLKKNSTKADFLHEVGHIVGANLTQKKKIEWDNFYDKNKNKLLDTSGSKCIVRQNSQEGYAETFARCQIGKNINKKVCSKLGLKEFN